MAAHKFTERKDTSTRTDADPGVAESWGATGPRFGRVAGEHALVTCSRENGWTLLGRDVCYDRAHSRAASTLERQHDTNSLSMHPSSA